MLPSIDLTKLAFHYDLRHPGVAIGGGALLGAGLGAGVGALTADPEENESRWGHALGGAMLGGALGAGAGAAAANWSAVGPAKKPFVPVVAPKGSNANVNDMLAGRSQPPVAAPAPVAAAPVAAPVAAAPAAAAPARAFMVQHPDGPDVMHVVPGHPDGDAHMESIVTGERRTIDPAHIVGDAGTVDEATAALMGADHTHPIMQHLGGDNMKTSSFWATELQQMKQAQIMSPEQYASVNNTFKANDRAAMMPYGGAAAGAGLGLAASHVLGGGDVDPETGEKKGPSAMNQLVSSGIGATLGGVGGLLAKKHLTVTPRI